MLFKEKSLKRLTGRGKATFWKKPSWLYQNLFHLESFIFWAVFVMMFIKRIKVHIKIFFYLHNLESTVLFLKSLQDSYSLSFEYITLPDLFLGMLSMKFILKAV